MKIVNIFNHNSGDLQRFEDDRGLIADIFYNNQINHVNIIESNPGAIRGNHFHRLTTQHIFIISGSLEYWYSEEQGRASNFIVAHPGDLVTSGPGEIHAMKVLDDNCVFMSFSEGLRGGKDFELDTFRVPSIIKEVL